MCYIFLSLSGFWLCVCLCVCIYLFLCRECLVGEGYSLVSTLLSCSDLSIRSDRISQFCHCVLYRYFFIQGAIVSSAAGGVLVVLSFCVPCGFSFSCR